MAKVFANSEYPDQTPHFWSDSTLFANCPLGISRFQWIKVPLTKAAGDILVFHYCFGILTWPVGPTIQVKYKALSSY